MLNDARDFKVSDKNRCIRFENWRDFVSDQSIIRTQKSAVCIAFVTFNLSLEAKKMAIDLLTYCNADIVIVDNFSDPCHFEPLKNIANQNNRLTLLRSVANLGGSGGYAIALEHALANEYENVIITEDDATLENPQDILKIIAAASKQGVHSIFFKNNNTTSFNFHWMLYPIEVIKLAGVPDPRYFMRSDDFEFGNRINGAISQLHLPKIENKNINYNHPLIKETKTVWIEYFSIRNSLESYVRHGYFILYLSEVVKKLPYVFTRIIYHYDFCSLKILYGAVIDHFRSNMSFASNTARMRTYRTLNGFYPILQYHTCSKSEFLNMIENQNIFLIGGTLKKILPLTRRFDNRIRSLFKRHAVVISTGFTSPLLPLSYFFNNAIYVLESDPITETIKYSIVKHRIRFSKLRLLLCFTASAVFSLIIIPIFVISYITKRK